MHSTCQPGRLVLQRIAAIAARARRSPLAAVLIGLSLGLSGCAAGGAGLAGADPASGAVATGSIPDRGVGRASGSFAAVSTTVPGASSVRPSAKIALVLPLSAPGELGVLAKAMKQAAELALFEHDNPGLQLLVKDDKGTPDGARAAAEVALNEGAEIVLGPLLAAAVEAVRPVASKAGKVVIAFSNDRRVAGNGVHLLSYIPDHDVERIVSFAAQRGDRRFAALVPDDDYGRIVEAALARAVTETGGRLVAIERYVSNGTGMLEPARRLSTTLQSAPDAADGRLALLLPGAAEQLASLGPLLTYTGLDVARVRLLGTAGWDQVDLGRDKAFVGAFYPGPDRSGWTAFATKFSSVFGTKPPRLASLAFDAMGVAIALAADRTSSRLTSATIMRPEGFRGVDGALRFMPDGTARRGLAVYEVQAMGTAIVDPPAPPSSARTPLSTASAPSN